MRWIRRACEVGHVRGPLPPPSMSVEHKLRVHMQGRAILAVPMRSLQTAPCHSPCTSYPEKFALLLQQAGQFPTHMNLGPAVSCNSHCLLCCMRVVAAATPYSKASCQACCTSQHQDGKCIFSPATCESPLNTPNSRNTTPANHTASLLSCTGHVRICHSPMRLKLSSPSTPQAATAAI